MNEVNEDSSKFKIPEQLALLRKEIYGSKNTDAHKFATKLVMYSDTLCRQMLLEKMQNDVLKNGQKLTKEKQQKILNFVDEQFVNYGYNVSGAQMWIEKIFGVQFLKYLFRHHKAYLKVLKANPSGVIAQQATQHISGIDIADPTDTLLNHSYIENLENRWVDDHPIEQLADLVTGNMTMPLGIFDRDAWYHVYN